MAFEIGIHTFGEISPDPFTRRVPSALERMRDTVEQAVVAEQAGLDVFGVGEHHRGDFIASSPAVMLAAIAARTCKIRLTSAVTVLSSLDPVRLFQDFATLDLVSGGRAEIIAGRGSHIDSFPLFGYDLADYDALFAEKLELLVAIRNEHPISWQGTFRPALDAADVAPRPVQSRLPIFVGVGGTPSSGARAGRLGLPLAYGVLLGRVDDALRVDEAYNSAAVGAGYDPRSLDKTIAGHGFVARTSQEARDLMYPYFSNGMVANARHRAQAGPRMPRPMFDTQASPVGALMAGSPQEVIDKLMLQHELYNNNRVLVYMGLGGVPQQDHLKAIELLGTEVAPVLRKEITVTQPVA
ncbi:LLM class flavin-dependent oxidoreductase [Amycolatopsis pithecellobii]|uniref:LLM class flavin-dependent oxidoreductase n=1 Tax=Amycolatopsis pithecellobii TaxID=664692 RepID=A0A6N7Z5A8_9PSEU|nr:LLM class flavin-dependent oxidoreductase [Amycolatopsis pithecellobii]MTD55734.1 LLM class flavin-dependent oxidoreductase [Amycolatopsis pithecellobii]